MTTEITHSNNVIRVLSFSFDGCLFNLPFLNDTRLARDIVKSNQHLLSQIKKERDNYSETRVYIGSHRQSMLIDYLYSGADQGNKGSCFGRIQEIATALKANFDPFLLADIFEKLPDGKSYYTALKQLDKNNTYYDNGAQHNNTSNKQCNYQDKNKVIIVYAQVHKTAVENPGKKIVYDFYDGKQEILQVLNSFFSGNKNLIPSNVTLKLHQYGGNKIDKLDNLRPRFIGRLQGAGYIDRQYRKTVDTMVSSCKKNANFIDVTTGLDKTCFQQSLFTHLYLDAIEMASKEGNKPKKAYLAKQGLAVLDNLNYFQEKKKYSSEKLTHFIRETHAIIENPEEQQITQYKSFLSELNWERSAVKAVGFGALALLGASIATISATVAIASFGFLTPLSSLGIAIGTTLVVQSLSIITTLFGAGMFAVGAVFSYRAGQDLHLHSQMVDIAVKATAYAAMSKHGNTEERKDFLGDNSLDDSIWSNGSVSSPRKFDSSDVEVERTEQVPKDLDFSPIARNIT